VELLISVEILLIIIVVSVKCNVRKNIDIYEAGIERRRYDINVKETESKSKERRRKCRSVSWRKKGRWCNNYGWGLLQRLWISFFFYS
jgi:hypothetical protein